MAKKTPRKNENFSLEVEESGNNVKVLLLAEDENGLNGKSVRFFVGPDSTALKPVGSLQTISHGRALCLIPIPTGATSLIIEAQMGTVRRAAEFKKKDSKKIKDVEANDMVPLIFLLFSLFSFIGLVINPSINNFCILVVFILLTFVSLLFLLDNVFKFFGDAIQRIKERKGKKGSALNPWEYLDEIFGIYMIHRELKNFRK